MESSAVKFIIILLFLGTGGAAQANPGDGTHSDGGSHAESSLCSDSYTLRKGDTFAKIARQRAKAQNGQVSLFGPHGAVKQVSVLNKKKFQDPNQIQEGITIQLPCSERSIASSPLIASTSRAQFKRRLQRELSEEAPPLTIPVVVPPPAPEPEPVAEVEEEEPEEEIVAPVPPKKVKPEPPRKVSDNESSFTIGGGILGPSGATTLPNGFANLVLDLGKGVSLSGSADGFIATYGEEESKLFNTLQAQYKLGLNFKMFKFLSLGLGYRLFTYGYSVPDRTTAISHDAVLSVGFHFIPFGKAQWDTVVDARAAVLSTSSAAGAFSAFPQFSGYRLQTAIHLPLGANFYFGPYFFVDNVSLNLTQTLGTTGSPSFLYNGMGGGVHLGVRF